MDGPRTKQVREYAEHPVGLALSCGAAVVSGMAGGMPVHADDYRFGHGDTIAVTVVGHAEFGGTVEVLEDGTVTLPVVGQVKVAGLTLAETTEQLRKLYGKRLVTPEIYVSLAAKRISYGYVLGAVKKPGIYQFKDRMSVFELLVAADGLSADPAIAMPRCCAKRPMSGSRWCWRICWPVPPRPTCRWQTAISYSSNSWPPCPSM